MKYAGSNGINLHTPFNGQMKKQNWLYVFLLITGKKAAFG
jgi:hypothetical protein